MKKILALILGLVLVIGLLPAALAEGTPDLSVASSVYRWALSPAVMDESSNVTVEIMQAPSFEKKTYTTAYPLDNKNSLTGTTRAEALVAAIREDYLLEVLLNAADEVIGFEIVEQSGGGRSKGAFNYYFDSAQFGGELTNPGGVPGRMVAQGWILNKDNDAKNITIGDGNHVTNVFEQTYTLSDDCQIYVVDNSYQVEGQSVYGTWAGKAGTMDDIMTCPVSADGLCPGEIYYEPIKYNALCIFDQDYTAYENGAMVNELYLFRNPLILPESKLVQPDGMTYDGLSWIPAVSCAEESHSYDFEGSCEPFEVMADRLYSVGDAYTNTYLFVGDDGTMSMLDQGNTTATYQYWLNIDKVGYDPRELDNIILTHGHGDHYQALVENVAMNTRYNIAKGTIKYGEQYLDVATSAQNATGFDYLGYPELGPTLSDDSIRYCLTQWDVWYEWRDDLGGGVSLYPFLSIGHTPDTASFGFIFTATANDEIR